jgi:rubrerythrin
MINTKAELIEHLKDLLAVESIARDTYKQDLIIFKKLEITTILNQIEQDEEYHIQLLQELILMLEQP